MVHRAPYATSEPIAIVGLGCVLPDALNPGAFWENALAGRCSIAPLRGAPWDWERLALPFRPRAARVAAFTPDWRALRIPPADAAAMNPAQLHVMEAGRQALADVHELPRDRTGTWLGATGLGWRPDTGLRVRADALAGALREAAADAGVDGAAAVAAARAALEARLLPASEEPVVNSAASIAAGRLAAAFDLRGPHLAVDAGFASGLAALDLACRALRNGTVDCALIGAASELLSPAELMAFARMGVLAPGDVRPFDAEAAGTLPGEGAVLLAAKRLDDAIRDGDTVHAVVLGVGQACDGGAISLLGSRADGQALAMARALAQAGVEPATIGFVECHATGAPRGDAAEVRALARTYGAAAPPLPLGSAKPLVGHLRGAAGAVGLLRAVLALRRGEIPAQAGFSRASPELGLEGTPLVVPTSRSPLLPRAGAPVARAAITALSLGGLACHAVLERFEPRPRRAPPARRASAERIAVIGLGGVFPGSDGVDAFWESLLRGKDAIREVPPERWDAGAHCDPDPEKLDRSYTRLGCFADPPALEARWRLPPAASGSIDPAHLLALRAAEEAVGDARLESGRWDRERTGVFLGFMACQGRKLLAEVPFHFARLAAEAREALLAGGVAPDVADGIVADARRRVEEPLPALTEDALPGWLGSIAAARIARRFDLRGPQLAIESACASTLAAVHAAAQALRDGTCDTAIAGGLWADMQPEFYVGSCRFNALSPTGSTPFDARANGFVPGEGSGVLVLRRLADAERDGQRVAAILRGVGASSDGHGRSVLAPSAEGEALAMARALEDAGVDPAQVDYVECHGTGTALGDATEAEACLRAYGRGRRRPLRLGSVKSNVGHLLAAAGAPALVKTIRALRDGVLPPTVAVDRPNPAIDFQAGPLAIVTAVERWRTEDGEPRRAGVSGFGLGGTNVHAVLEEYRPSAASPAIRGAPARRSRAPAPLPIAAAGGVDLADCVRRLRAAARLAGATEKSFRAALAAMQREAAEAPYRVALVLADARDLEPKLALLRGAVERAVDQAALQREGVFAAAAVPALPVAAVFPGQGPQYPNMLRGALQAFPSLGATLDAADRAYERLCGRALRPAFFTEDPVAWAQRDEDIHCAVFAVNVAVYRLLVDHGLRPSALMGQSAGELAALVGAGAVAFEDGLAIVRERTLSVLSLETPDPGRMVAVACGAAAARSLLSGLPGYAAIAADNGPGACIVSCDSRALPALLERAARDGVDASILDVSHGYHSRLIERARPRYERFLETIPFRRPDLAVVSTITGASLAGLAEDRLPAHLASQFTEPVRLTPAVEELYRSGARLFVECGPKSSVSAFISAILGGRPHVAQPTLHPKTGEVEQLARALACLFVHGAARLSNQEEGSMCTADSARSSGVASAATRSAASPRAAPRPPSPPPESAPGCRLDLDLLALLQGVRDLIDGYLRRAAAAQPADERAPLASPPVRDAPAPGDLGRADRAAGANSRRANGGGAIEVPAPEPAPAVTPAAGADPSTAGAPAPRAQSTTLDPQPRAPEPAPPQERRAAEDDVRRALLDEYVSRTGYPQDMLRTDLDLEADLGIDTVKQVAALAAVRQRFGIAPDPTFKLRDARTIDATVAWLFRRLAPAGGAAAPGSSDVPSPQPRAPLRAPVAPEAAASPAPGAARETVLRMLVEEYVRRTGYPQEMLAPDLDLEAELGIDTVKQVAVLAAVRARLGLPPDPKFKLRDASTIAKAVDILVRRMGPPPPDPPDAPRPPPGGGGKPTGPEPARSAPRLDALTATARNLPQARNPMPPRTATARLLETMLSAVPADEGHEIAGLSFRATAAPAAGGHEPLVDVTPVAERAGALHLRAALGQTMAEADVLPATGPAAPAEAPPEIAAAIAPGCRGRAATGDELRSTLASVLGDAQGVLGWARSDGFMVAAGGVRLADGDEACRSATLLSAAEELASFAWLGLTGAPHALSGIERARFHRLPAPGAEIGLHARMVSPEGGLWRADVLAVCEGVIVAEIRGLTGAPLAAHVVRGGPTADAAARAWRRFCRRMRGEAPAEDVA